MKYIDVVNNAKREVANRGTYGKINLSDCSLWQNGKVINLWSYWQGYQLKDLDEGIDILLVGQDWGNPDTNPEIVDIIKRIQMGDEDALYSSGIMSATDRNLINLFKVLGCDITSISPGKRLLFTNYCLSYRTESETGGMTKSLLKKDKELFDDLVKAVKPKFIICLGKITYEMVSGKVTRKFVNTIKEGKPFVSVYPNDGSIAVYGVPHCGARGLNNVGGFEVMKKVWGQIAYKEGYSNN